MYYIILCSRCGQHLLATETQKTRLCPYCGMRLSLVSVTKVATANNAQEASKMIRTLKSKGRIK